MNNVNNRKLFRKSNAARNKLREAGGIMASDAELMQTVAQYQVGGPVLGGNLPQRPVTAYSGTAAQFRRLPRSVQQQVLEAENTNRGIAGALAQAGKYGSIPIELGYGAITGAYDLARRGLQGVGLADPSVQEETRPLGLFGMFDEMQEKGAPLQNTYELEGMLAMQQGEVDPAIAKAVQNQMFQQQADEIMMPEVEVDTPEQAARKKAEQAAATEAAGGQFTTDLGGEEAELRMTRPGDGAERDAGRAPMAATDPQIIAAKKGELGPQKQVEALITTGTQEEQEKSLKDLMAEFTGAAPKYEGMDKGLAIAKIGFAMAAGQSPNAISNIASALEKGAEDFIKDKKDRDAFNRQVQLSALQYGLGEQSKIRAQKRADERNLMKFVNDDGDVITVSMADYMANGRKIPEGLRTETMYTADQKAIVDRYKAFLDAQEEMNKRKYMTRADVRTDREAYADAVEIASQAENTAFVLENVMKMNADGELTGAANALKTGAAKVGAFLGIEVPESFDNKQLAITQLKGALQGVIKVTLAGTQSANSISNRDVELLIQGFLADGIMNVDSNGVLTFANVPAKVINQSLKNGLQAVRTAQAKALNDMSAIEGELAGLLTPQGLPGTSILEPYQQVDVGAEIQKRRPKTLSFDKETNLYSAVME